MYKGAYFISRRYLISMEGIPVPCGRAPPLVKSVAAHTREKERQRERERKSVCMRGAAYACVRGCGATKLARKTRDKAREEKNQRMRERERRRHALENHSHVVPLINDRTTTVFCSPSLSLSFSRRRGLSLIGQRQLPQCQYSRAGSRFRFRFIAALKIEACRRGQESRVFFQCTSRNVITQGFDKFMIRAP